MAKYKACILGLNLVVDMNIQEFLVIGNSDLLVHQVQGVDEEVHEDRVQTCPENPE